MPLHLFLFHSVEFRNGTSAVKTLILQLLFSSLAELELDVKAILDLFRRVVLPRVAGSLLLPSPTLSCVPCVPKSISPDRVTPSTFHHETNEGRVR